MRARPSPARPETCLSREASTATVSLTRRNAWPRCRTGSRASRCATPALATGSTREADMPIAAELAGRGLAGQPPTGQDAAVGRPIGEGLGAESNGVALGTQITQAPWP